MTSFYNILEVNEQSTTDEIKKAYRRLSLKWHPDKNQGNPEAQGMFQKISEAYETLGDAQKKREYDMMNNNPFFKMMGQGMQGMQGMPSQGMHSMHGENLEDILASVFSGGMGNIFGSSIQNPHGNPNIRIFHGAVPGFVPPGFVQPGFSPFQKPTPIIKTITIPIINVLNGGNIPVEIDRWIMENGNKTFEQETLYVPIPKGIDDNEIIILREKGNVLADGCVGDIKLFIKVENNTEFIRKGLDLVYNKQITLKEALCGFSFELKYINDKVYTINNNSGNIIPPEFQKVIPNMGLTRENHTGNLIIHFHITFPETLSNDKIEQLKGVL